jgi:signal peptidase I
VTLHLPELLSALLDAGLEVSVTVAGGSMCPAIADGQVVRVRKVPAASLREGHVVALARPGHAIVVHRITGIRYQEKQMLVRTMGDNCLADDGWSEEAELLGRVCCVPEGPGPVRRGLRRLCRRAAIVVRAALAGHRPGR